MSNDDRVFILSPLSNSKMVAVFIVDCFKLKCSLYPDSSIIRKAILTSYISVYLGCGDRRLKMPLMNFSISACCGISLDSSI